MDFIVNDDHWAFLDNIEAPMWVDLSLEADFNSQDINDNWFYTSHQFHQCSSGQLKFAFSHFGDESTILESDLLGPSSPKLPHSVSKSRGKQYRSTKWKGDSQDFSLDKPHPVKVLTRKSSCAKLGHGHKGKHKPSFIDLKEASTSSKASVVCESSLSGKAISDCSKPLPACGDPGSSLSSKANKTRESNPTSTVTSESGQQQQHKVVDVSSHTFGHTIGLLSIIKKSLRKSYITRQATRVEINNDGKQLKGRNSTSSKSSVGSSSNPRCDVRISMSTSVRPKEITPDSRNVVRMTHVAKSKTNYTGIVKALTIKTEEGALNNRSRGQVNTAKPGRNEAAKQKVQYRDSSTKALVPTRVNEQNPSLAVAKLKKKTVTSGSRKLAGDGKENVTGRTSVIQNKCSGRGITGGEAIAGRGPKGTRQALSGTNDRAGIIHSKGKGRGQRNLEKPKQLVQRVHFR